jgi:UDP-N-acetylmuramate: L-alanyl-gamma-D-glutamyl-meso-diaminopimelate ligase
MAKSIHLIAVGGAVMHNLAIALQERGYVISGSDDHIAEPSLSRLRQKGLLPEAEGWFPERIHPNLDGVILGMHARADNPELRRALELQLPVWSFPEFLYRESREKLRMAICGSHGKTSITAMLMHVLQRARCDFDYMVGAQLDGFEVMVRLSDAPWMVLEGDEYLASALDPRPKFLHYHPRIALISGIAWDHVNVFPTMEAYREAFRSLLRSLGPQDHLVYCQEDEELNDLVAGGCQASLHPYGCPEYRVEGGQIQRRDAAGWQGTSLIGRHNLLNAAGAAEVAALLGLDPQRTWAALADFPGAARRLQVLARGPQRSVIRDFAHSPSKVRASTQAVADQFGAEGLLACLELHTFSSLNPEFLPQYRGALDAAGKALVYFDPQAVAAKRLAPLEANQVREALGRSDLEVFSDRAQLEARLRELASGLRCLLLMSSGSFSGLSMEDLANFTVRA